MPERFSRTSVQLDVETGTQAVHERPDPDTPFQILIMGDFSGRANRGLHAPLTGRRPRQVDCDNLDEVMSEMQVGLDLPRVRLRFRELDDFHPDRIYQSAELFQKLADARSRPAPPETPAQTQPQTQAQPPRATGHSLLESMLADADETPASAAIEDPGGLAAFLKKVVKPHLAEREDPRQQAWAERVDQATGEQMRAILRHPQFQAIEAAWRAVWMLIQQLQPDSELKIFLFDATLEELTADPGLLAKCLAAPHDPWALIAGNFVFGQDAESAARLRKLGRIAAAAGAPFLAEALPPDESTAAEQWGELTRSPEASWIGLALPRFLLRLPYGKGTSPVEAFDFEEMPESVHAAYLWGNPAFACASILGRAFRSHGWDLRAGLNRQIEGLPQHVYQADGESVAKPCAEVLLTENEADFLMANGLMPLASIKGRDAILLVRLQSISDPPAALSGRWN
jgi:type VI secretion system protein ImpC